jgi:hypothetical protein
MSDQVPGSLSEQRTFDSSLQREAELLRETALFDGSPLGRPLLEKQLIFLVLAGFKPVAQVASGHWMEVEGGRKTVADDPREVGSFLKSLGLCYSLSSFDAHATDAIVALQPQLIDEYRHAQDATAVGRLFGYPETAVRAFESGGDALLSSTEQEQLERDAGLPDGLTIFCLSRDHAAEELAVVTSWQEALRAVGLAG